MSARISSEAIPRRWPAYGNLAIGAAIVVGGLALLVAMRLGWIDILPHDSERGRGDQPLAPAALPIDRAAHAREAGGSGPAHCRPPRMAPIQQTRPVPATITYDAARRVPVNSPVAGIVVKVLVEPGQQVAEHQPLAELSSPEIGLARDEVERRRADLELARKQLAFCGANRQERRRAAGAIGPKAEAGRPGAGARASERWANTAKKSRRLFQAAAGRSGAQLDQRAGGRHAQQAAGRRAEERREVAAAQFSAACETARFSAAHERGRLQAAAEQAERLLAVSQQALANLLGPLADRTPVTDRQKLSELVLLAPIAGQD